jgi:hypothetical protein
VEGGQEPEVGGKEPEEGEQALREVQERIPVLGEVGQSLEEGGQALDGQNLEFGGLHSFLVTQGFDVQEEECPAGKNLTNYESKFGYLWLFHFTF